MAVHVRHKASAGTLGLQIEGRLLDLIYLVEDKYTGDVDSAAFDDVHQVINIAVLFEMDVSVVYSVL